ncbi:MAG: T9SS type A sorting domain-containing protein, partial [candidate division WOR-3 bacterium]
SSWDIIEDFSGLSGGWDYFVTEWAYDLSSYVGQSINIAWHAYALGGLWYIWLVDDVVVDTTILSVSENPLGPSAKVEVWPNPSRGRVNFALPIGSVGEISIYEPSGRLVHSAKGVNEASFDLSRGIYFYRVVAEESVRTGTITVE